MSIGELLIIAVSVSMDAFAVAVCKGLSIQKLKLRHALTVGLWFGVFQALMPTVGWLVGSVFADLITKVDHWVVFILLSIIGTAVGLFAGIFFHQFVVQTAEVDAVMFGRVIKPMSYVYSAAMSMLFTLLVSLFMQKKLHRIDMVESLKAPE